MKNTPIKFTGSNFTLSVLHLYEEKPEIIRQELENKIAQAPSFLKHAPVVINISDLNASINWKLLQQAVTDTGLHIIGVSGCENADLKAEINRSGLPVLAENKDKSRYVVPKYPEMSSISQRTITSTIETRFIDTPVRSGQCIYTPNCDLIVISHVSAGAELIADGNIHVYGVMRGRVLAGANGNRNAQIFCTNLIAELVSIAGIYWIGDKIPSEFYGKAVRLYLTKNILTIQPLN